MTDSSFVGVLALVTLGIFAVIAIVYFMWFSRKPENRHPMDTPAGRQADEDRREEIEEAREETHTPPPLG